MVTPTRSTPLSLRNRRVAANASAATRSRPSRAAKKAIDVVIDDDFDKTDEEASRALPPRRNGVSDEDEDDDDDDDVTQKEEPRLTSSNDDDDSEDESGAEGGDASSAVVRGVRLLLLNLALLLAHLDYRLYLSAAASLWMRQTPTTDAAAGLWVRGSDHRLRRRPSGWCQLLALLVALALLWAALALSFAGPAAVLPTIAIASSSSSSPSSSSAPSAPLSASSDVASKLLQLEAELKQLRADNEYLLLARHSHNGTPDGRKVLSEDEVRAIATAAAAAAAATATAPPAASGKPSEADVEAIVRRVLTPDVLMETGKSKIEFLVRTAIDADALARKELYVTPHALERELEQERDAQGDAVAKAIAAERSEHAKLHTADAAALAARLAALGDAGAARIDEAAVRAIVRELLAGADAKAAAAADAAAEARAAADEALRVAQRVPAASGSGVDESAVRRVVEAYVFGDTVGQADWALNQAGAVVLPQTSAPIYTPITERTLGDVLALRRAVAMPAEVALSPDNTPGNCYAFAGAQGTFAVRLAQPVRVTAVSIDHIAAAVAFDRRPAPRQFTVLGFADAHAQGDAIPLGRFEYALDGGVVQTFAIASPPAAPIHSVVLQIDSNHGAPFTCLYRFRVHGTKPN